MVLSRVGETALAWTAGDRAVTAAEHAEAGLLAAMSAFRLAHVFIRRKHTSQARDLVTGAASAIERSASQGDPERLSVLGGLYLADALAAAASFDRAAADRSLAAARRVAERLGEDRNDHWTAFGPTNVRIHEVSAAGRVRRCWHRRSHRRDPGPAAPSSRGSAAAAARSAWTWDARMPSSAMTPLPST